jgi:hypothetical protein
MIDYMEEMRNNGITELKFTMNGKTLHVEKATVINEKCMEIEFSEGKIDVKGIHPDWKINHSSTKSQQQHIKEYLEAGHSITPLEALEMFGCFRLGAQIFDLKKKGMDIEMTMRKDENTGKRYAVYYIAPAKESK